MVSVAIICKNSVNVQITDCSVHGFDIGYSFENVRDVSINGGRLNVNHRGIVGSQMVNTQIKNVKINQNSMIKNLTLHDLIKFLIHNTRLDNDKILDVYKGLGKPLNEPLLK